MTIMTLMHFIINLSMLSSIAAQGINMKDYTRIVGGSVANISEYSYQASLQVWNGYYFFPYCGGIVITPNFVLTAAHCLYLPSSSKKGGNVLVKSSSLRVSAGSNDSYGSNIPGQRILVKRVIPHERYDSVFLKFNNDIALLELQDNFTMTDYLNVITLRQVTNATEEELCTVSGWGAQSSEGNVSRKLLSVNVNIVDRKTCKKSYGRKLPKSSICAAGKGKDSCQGDSGGPLVCSGELTGIVSFGYGCADPKFPGVYTDVSKFTDWIHTRMSEDDSDCKRSSVILIILNLCIIFW